MIIQKEHHEIKIQSCKSSLMKKGIAHRSNSINLDEIADMGENCICGLCCIVTALPAVF